MTKGEVIAPSLPAAEDVPSPRFLRKTNIQRFITGIGNTHIASGTIQHVLPCPGEFFAKAGFKRGYSFNQLGLNFLLFPRLLSTLNVSNRPNVGLRQLIQT